ncbi:L-lactate 2-monooxygenase [Salinisphaera orenii MK-B5]|uniref:L-lactate 2-monooxygenase n=1 Tax=Salinisphaera orenii MK-B5 TaxID=856730 RepID=A0A423PFX9_9GAMM|nr:alpha-hydroxy-acid oxidizing protein [Salinisphaera orenii]ROO24494.1 L-lactate 2-monooxygenase [Salinisphaera orenii MK-B5]
MTTPYGNHQLSIYAGGLKGRRPDLPLRYVDLEARARQMLSDEAYWYVAGGAGESSMTANRDAFDRYRLVPRMLTDISVRDLGRTVLGKRQPTPLMIAPLGVQEIIHERAELAVAEAAAAVDVPMILSTVSSFALEEVRSALGATSGWYQLYWPNDDALATSLVQRAEAAGYEAIVITLDTKMLAWRERDLEGAYLPFLQGQGLANYFSDPVFRAGLEQPPEADMRAAVKHWSNVFAAPARTWEDLARLRAATDLPLVLKGVLHPEDALAARAAGMDGVIVSNHGGRQVDGSIAAIDALAGVVDAVGDQIDVLFDSGIRRGADVLKAIALGADAVLVGRPYAWGLACDGAAGVEEVLRRLLADTDLSMALSGVARLDDMSRRSLQQPLPAGM